jgi:hypothetical protein
MLVTSFSFEDFGGREGFGVLGVHLDMDVNGGILTSFHRLLTRFCLEPIACDPLFFTTSSNNFSSSSPSPVCPEEVFDTLQFEKVGDDVGVNCLLAIAYTHRGIARLAIVGERSEPEYSKVSPLCPILPINVSAAIGTKRVTRFAP